MIPEHTRVIEDAASHPGLTENDATYQTSFRASGVDRQYASRSEGRSQMEIAERMSLTRREVELTVRYLEELVRERLGAT